VLKLYHNPKCSKSRQALALLRERGAAFETVEYLRTPPSRDELRALIERAADPPCAFVRTKDPKFREANIRLCDEAGIDEVLDVLVPHPELLERPIVADARRAVIGRPTERIVELLRKETR
jgi:arsenate reductase